MNHIYYSDECHGNYPIGILIKTDALNRKKIHDNYIKPLILASDIKDTQIMAIDLSYQDNGKCSVKHARAYLEELMPIVKDMGMKHLLVCDGTYYKLLTGEKKVEPNHGYIKPCKIKGYEDINIILSINYRALFHNDAAQDKIDLSLETLIGSVEDNHEELGKDIIQFEEYPVAYDEVQEWLDKLHDHPKLKVDVEAFSLKFWKAGIASIGFAWNQHEGVSWLVDYQPYVKPKLIDGIKHYGKQIDNRTYKRMLREFFESYDGRICFHNANYDVKILIYELFMDDLLDMDGLRKGLQVMARHLDDTKLITYLATNSTAGNDLKLKILAHKFAGNYAQDAINDVRLIPHKELLRYNLTDCLCTWYVYNEYYPRMVNDKQLEIYQNIMMPSVAMLLHIELCGMPMDMEKVAIAKKTLEDIARKHYKSLQDNPVIKQYWHHLRQKEYDACHLKWKKKTAPLEDFNYVTFNPRSPNQLQELLYERHNYPVIDKTKSKQPAVGAKTLKKLKNHTNDPDHIRMFDDLIEFSKAEKILTTFIVAFEENTVLKADGWYYLHGNFNLGGTVSGRLSSSSPNLQNIPSGSTYAKLVKDCFRAPDDWLFGGADFASLEDRISALTTKDPQKLKVYTDGYDGHSLRAYGYFGSQMPDIDPDSVESINSISDLYPELRQDSKAPTFALTYQGTYITLMNNLGWSKKKSKDVEEKYHEMYVVSDEWVQKQLHQATVDGYVTVAFGLRIRTPILAKTILNTSSTPYEAAAEGRTAGNALGQSYCMLNNRAGIELQQRLLDNPEMFRKIKPCAHIHDAQYFCFEDDIEVIKWLNDNLGECMAWQELPEIQHDQVHLSGELDIFYPSWKYAITLPNNASEDEILDICEAAQEE